MRVIENRELGTGMKKILSLSAMTLLALVATGCRQDMQDQPKFEDKSTLHIRAEKGDVVASWRANVLLEEGRYRLQGLARTAQVTVLTNVVERGNGAGLRVSGSKRTQQIIGDAPWTQLEHEFEVMQGEDDKELVCELRARQGEVWFDAASLRLIRVK